MDQLKKDNGHYVLAFNKYGEIEIGQTGFNFRYYNTEAETSILFPVRASLVQKTGLFVAHVALKFVEIMGWLGFIGLYFLGLLERGDIDYGYIPLFGLGLIGLALSYSSYRTRVYLKHKASANG